ncbi:hypothetical protein [Enterobacter chengduensis]|uniref:hypothetical protein n=1 Tax=Enterobacter chengduensis TaxID=2494701 RepID=UPI000AC5848E|nr:hypothetical protein [Enterobacter chengduensis]
MSMEFYNFKPRKNLYDGEENYFYEFSEKICIPFLNVEIDFKNIDAIPLWNVDSSLKKEMASNISGVMVLNFDDDPDPTYKYNNLDVYIYSGFLENKKIHIVMAQGESQPARYKIILLGLGKVRTSS